MKTITKATLLLLVLVLSSATLLAQSSSEVLSQTIRGIVTDKASGYPMSYATVNVTGISGKAVTTDEEGRFTIGNVPVGRHTIEARFVGYEPTVFKEILVTSAKEVYLEIPLKENIQELGEVVVRPQTNKDQPLNKMAITGARMLSVEEASRYAGGVDDPARLVGSFAGVASGLANNGISVHGNAPHLLQWRLEGVEVPNPNHFADVSVLGGGVLSSLSNYVMGNSDFFMGAFPAEYGNAISGVFDINLRNGNNQRHEHAFQLGVLGIDFASEGPLSKNHTSSYIFNYRYSTTGLVGKIVNLKGMLDYQDLNLKMNFPTKNAGTFTIWGTGLIDKAEPDFEEDPAKWEYADDANFSVARQTMGAGGISHRYFFNNNTQWKTTLAATYLKHRVDEDMYDEKLNHSPYTDMDRRNTKLILNSSFNKKYSARHTNQTGFTYTKMFYNMFMRQAPFANQPLETITESSGNTDLISAYTSSSFNLNEKFTLNAGINGQFLALNNHWTIEPRVGVKWQVSDKISFALAYGLHSRMENMDVYFTKTKATGDKLVNKDLDVTKTHHLLYSFNYKLSENISFRIEPYFQQLFDVPVEMNGTYSVLNRMDYFVDIALENKGKGRNIGVDLTLEKYLSRGYYYMLTASIFESKYQDGSGNWHNTRFNRNYIINGLVGKEWMIGRNKQNILSTNLKITLQGGDRYSPIDIEATLNHPDKEVQYNESKPFSQQFSPQLITNATVSYKINKRRLAHEFAVKVANITGAGEYTGHKYYLQTNTIEPLKQSNILPNISYKVEF